MPFKERVKTPEEANNSAERYRSRADEHRAFQYLTDDITDKYSIGKLLGNGGEGSVYAGVRLSDGTEVAIKFTMMNSSFGMITIPGESTPIPIEVGLMKMVSKPVHCPNVLELLEWFIVQDYLMLILEKPSLCQDLLDFCGLHNGRLAEPLARGIMVQMVRAAHHCCASGVFHNDIKPENILINTETLQVKLIDFGRGELLTETPCMTCPGTKVLAPPEWFKENRYMGEPTTVWSLGILLYEMLCGQWSFEKLDEVVAGHLHFPLGLSKDCQVLISQCLAQEPKARPTFVQLLENRWLKGSSSSMKRTAIKRGFVAHLVTVQDTHEERDQPSALKSSSFYGLFNGSRKWQSSTSSAESEG